MKKYIFFFMIYFVHLVAENPNFSQYTYVDFDTSMNVENVEYKKKYSNLYNKSFLKSLKKLYEKNNLLKITKDNKPKIPLVIHQIWVGPKPLPDFYFKLSQTWKKSGWTYMLWTDREVKKIKLHNQKLYDKATSMVEKADILRYELLYQFGGVYVDMDFECLKPLDELNYSYDFYTGIIPNNARAVLANGLIGCKPKHKIMEKIVTNIEFYKDKPDQLSRNGVLYFSLMINNYLRHNTPQETNIALPITYFYPFKKHYGTNISNTDFIRPESFAIHYWGSHLAQKINLYNQKRFYIE